MPTPDPSPIATPVPDAAPSPEPTDSLKANSDVKVEVDITNQEQARSEVEPPVDTIEQAHRPLEPTAKDLLEHSWLRVNLQPDIKSHTDSVEPMGLINRVKGVLARSAGR